MNQSPKTSSHASSESHRKRWTCFFTLAALGCLADLLTKHFVFDWLGPPNGQGEHSLARGRLRRNRNRS